MVFAQEPTSRTKTGSLDLFWMCSRTGSTKKRTRKSQATPPGDHKAFFESCRQLKGFVEGEQAMASLACGGTIPIAVPGTETTSPTPAPVNIFWSTSDDSVANKLVLPANGATPESSMDVLQCLIFNCDPASFGRGNQDVMDPEYRKAVKLNSDQFATKSYPVDYGLIEHIEQILLPSICSKEDKTHLRKLHAELYRFNVS